MSDAYWKVDESLARRPLQSLVSCLESLVNEWVAAAGIRRAQLLISQSGVIPGALRAKELCVVVDGFNWMYS